MINHVREKEGKEGMVDYVNYSNTVEGWTPLHRACYSKNYIAVKTLIEYGAKLSIKDNDGKVPKDLIFSLNNSYVANQIRELLESSGEQGFSR